MGGGGSSRGRGKGTFYPPCHTLHYHMVLCPEGTSHMQLICRDLWCCLMTQLFLTKNKQKMSEAEQHRQNKHCVPF